MEITKIIVATLIVLLYLAFAGVLLTGVHYVAFTYLATYHWSLAWSAFLGALFYVMQAPVRALLEVLDDE